MHYRTHLFIKSIPLLLGMLIAAGTAFAQAPVPVSQEPRHRVVFENEKVRVLNVLIPPGDTTLYHVHSTPSVFVTFTKTKTGSQRLHQQPDVSGISTPGYTWFENLNPPHIKIHRVWNEDTCMYHVMDMELLSKDSGFSRPPLSLPAGKLIVDTPWARIYSIQLAANQQLELNRRQSNFVLVSIDNDEVQLFKDGEHQNKSLQPGSFFWISAGERFSITSVSNALGRFVLYQVR